MHDFADTGCVATVRGLREWLLSLIANLIIILHKHFDNSYVYMAGADPGFCVGGRKSAGRGRGGGF